MKEEKYILVVEDEVDLCHAIAVALKKAGYKSMGCATARDAMMKMKNQTYHCILTDIRLGSDSGEDLVEQIRDRKDLLNLDTPILVMSGYLDKGLVSRIARHIQGALVKPFEIKVLLDLVAKHVGRAR
jgi:DNA-binding NtrC family response regulator